MRHIYLNKLGIFIQKLKDTILYVPLNYISSDYFLENFTDSNKN